VRQADERARKDRGTNVFVGEYDRSVDGNGRLALPSAFRDALGERCYVSRSPHGCLAVTSVDDFRIGAQRVLDQIRDGERPESAARDFAVNSSLLAIDKQGRITLDEESRRHAGLNSGGQVVIAGALNCLQIWRPSRYRTVRVEDDVTQPARVWKDED
jgi:MraZ protein